METLARGFPQGDNRVTTTFFCPYCDLFASRLNTHVSKFASWFPEPGSWVVNAFSISWWDVKFYAFPPFSLVGRTLAKVCRDAAVGIMIVPLEYSSLVSTDAATPCGSSKVDTSSPGPSSVTRTGKSGPSPLQEAGPFSNTYFGQTIGQYNLSAATVDITGHSWRGGTRSQYDSAIIGWREFCLKREN